MAAWLDTTNYSRNYTLIMEEAAISIACYVLLLIEIWDQESPMVIIRMTGSVLNIISAALVFLIYSCG